MTRRFEIVLHVFNGVLNFIRDGKRVYTLLTLCYLIYVQSLDIDSAVCRCTTKSKFGKPFVVLWNSPTEGCHVNFSVHIELEKYGILTNSNQTWNGEVVTVFYNAQLGLYPYYRHENEKRKYNAGLPQLTNLTEHLKKASQDIAEKIPEPNYSGLAVIDWEGWRPLWDTNFGNRRLYQTKSIWLVRKEGKLKNKNDIKMEAKKRFENAGKRMIIETIELGKKLRPRALWGFYGFPCCHGNCSKQHKKWNDEVHWLYKSSTALFPSIYLMDAISDNKKYVADRLQEAFRVFQMISSRYGHELPVFPYLRPVYHYGARDFKMLNEADLENAIGQTVDFGSAGLILWGNHYDEDTSREVCLRYNGYVNNKLGPYISLLTEELEACSRKKCFSNGRCVETAVASEELGNKTCRSLVKYGTTFKFNNRTSEMQDLEQMSKSNTTTKDRNTKPSQMNNINFGKHELLNKNKTFEHLISKVNKTKLTETARQESVDVFASMLNATYTKSTMETKTQNRKLIEMLDSSANKTKQKSKSDPDWNKNAILGYNKKHEVDYLSLKKVNGPLNEKSLGNASESKLQELLDGNISDSSESVNEIGAKRSETEVNATSSDKTSKQKQTPKRGYSARVGEETAVRVPGVYIILITVTLGGALLMTIIYVAIYYTVNVRGRSRDNPYDYQYESADENPFSVDPHSPWWNDDVDPAEKLLKNKREAK